jgi:hypothetical protein
LPVGKKYIGLKIPEVIMENPQLATACLRGILDTEGCIYRRYSKKYARHPKEYNYLVIQLKMKTKKVVMQISEILTMAGISHNRLIQNGGCFVLRITSQRSVTKFIKTIGFRNPKNLNRLKRFLGKSF